MIKKIIEMAIQNGDKVVLIYQKSDQVIERIVTPKFFKGDLVVCYDHFKRARRNYKMESILAASRIGKSNDY